MKKNLKTGKFTRKSNFFRKNKLVNYLNLDLLVKAINLSGTTQLIINKCDILEMLDIYKLFYEKELHFFKSLNEMKRLIENKIKEKTENVEVIFSGDTTTI